MNTNTLFFNIYYCNSRQFDADVLYPKMITKGTEHHKLVFITGGKGKVTFGEKRYNFKKGTLIYYSPALPDDIKIVIEEPVTFLSVLFDYVNVILHDGKYSVADKVTTISLPTVQNLMDFYPVEAVFEKLFRTWNAKLPGYEFISKTLLQELFIAIFQKRNNKNPNYAASLKVEKVIQYMREHIDHKVSLNELAEMVQISSFHLSKIFKDATGYSIIEYFNKIKIDQAKVMLIEGDRKVKEIAHTLGFADEFYFSRIFKKTEGMSPSEYHNKNVHEI